VTDARITYDYLYRLALSGFHRSEARIEGYGDPDGHNALEMQGFERLMKLVSLYEDNEADFLRVIEQKRERVLRSRELADMKHASVKTGKKSAADG
jgi:hypothetical protein